MGIKRFHFSLQLLHPRKHMDRKLEGAGTLARAFQPGLQAPRAALCHYAKGTSLGQCVPVCSPTRTSVLSSRRTHPLGYRTSLASTRHTSLALQPFLLGSFLLL